VKLLLAVLHFFHSFGLNYGLSIILLTVVVRLGMLRLSISQAKSTIKMQELQPEIEKLKLKYKDDPKNMMNAQRELWKKHNYNPFGGCLGLFIQLPIFVALYKALSVDVELYGVSLFSNSFRWCGNLSAPDMLFYWGDFWNWLGLTSFNTGQGMFYLGPYFNLLPILTVILFVVQQRVAMPKPDPSNEQAMMQYRMMNWMMPIMGFFFFKMPSGLCIYFIISTSWAVAERWFLPTKKPTSSGDTVSEQVIDVEVEPQKPVQEKPIHQKPPKRERQHKEPTQQKEEGFLKRIWREVNEKASEQQKLGGTKKVKDKKRKK
jgi:YidC/Oxa1 family membrane protein insertase